jgi:hypothetical protein
MNQSPQIKPTFINSEDANPKGVENQLVEEADRWDPLGLADLGWGRPTWVASRWAPLRWVTFSCLLDPSQLGSAVEYAFYPDVLDILPLFPDKTLQKLVEFYQFKP